MKTLNISEMELVSGAGHHGHRSRREGLENKRAVMEAVISGKRNGQSSWEIHQNISEYFRNKYGR